MLTPLRRESVLDAVAAAHAAQKAVTDDDAQEVQTLPNEWAERVMSLADHIITLGAILKNVNREKA